MELVTSESKKRIREENGIIKLEGITSLRIIKLANESFLGITCPAEDGDDVYTIAIPNVCIKKFKKDELMEGG